MKSYLMFVGILAIIVFILSTDLHYGAVDITFFVVSFFFVLSLFGFVYFYTKEKVFAYITLIGLYAFFPFSIKAAAYIRSELDKERKLEFMKRINDK